MPLSSIRHSTTTFELFWATQLICVTHGDKATTRSQFCIDALLSILFSSFFYLHKKPILWVKTGNSGLHQYSQIQGRGTESSNDLVLWGISSQMLQLTFIKISLVVRNVRYYSQHNLLLVIIMCRELILMYGTCFKHLWNFIINWIRMGYGGARKGLSRES